MLPHLTSLQLGPMQLNSLHPSATCVHKNRELAPNTEPAILKALSQTDKHQENTKSTCRTAKTYLESGHDVKMFLHVCA